MSKLSCQEVLEQLSEYLDEDVRAELCAEIESHLTACHHCRAEVDTIKLTIHLYRTDEVLPQPITLNDRLRAALDAAYREHEEQRD